MDSTVVAVDSFEVDNMLVVEFVDMVSEKMIAAAVDSDLLNILENKIILIFFFTTKVCVTHWL